MKIKKVIKLVDDFYDDLASARDALWEAMSHHNELSVLFDMPQAIKRISRRMVYLRLKRQIRFHGWNVEQLKENISYLSELFDDGVEIEEFVAKDDYFPTNVGKSEAEKAVAYVYDALDKRNEFPNEPRKNTELRKNMQTVIHYSIDTFNADALNTFFKVVYKRLIGKSINEVDDSVDDDHLRYVVQKMKETRENKYIKAVMDRKAQKKQQRKAVKDRDVQTFIRNGQNAARKQSEGTRNKGGGKGRPPPSTKESSNASTNPLDSSNASTNSSSSKKKKKKKRRSGTPKKGRERGPSSSNGR